MADEIKIKITGDYDDKAAKEAIADAKEIEKLDPELEVTADTADATADLATVTDKAQALGKEDQIITVKAKIDAAEADLQRLKGELASIDDTAATTGNKIGTEMEEGTSKASSATHSMAGNVIGDSAAMATGFGPLGEAVGQLTEGLAGGEVAMKDLLTAGLGMGALALVAKTVTDALAAAKAVDAFNAKKVQDFTKALREGKTVIDSLHDSFVETGKIDFVNVQGQTKDLTSALADANITFDTFLQKIALGKDGFRDWVIAQGPLIGAGEDLNAVINAGNQFIDDRAAAEKAYTDQQIVSGATLRETERETRALNRATIDGTDAFKKSIEPTKLAAHQVDVMAENSAAADGAYRHLIGALDEQQAWTDVNQDIKDYNENTKHSEEETRNHIRAIADYVATTDTIPASKKTEILIDLNKGDVAAAEQAMKDLTRTRDLKILLTAVASQDTIKLLRSIGRGGTGIVDESNTRAVTTVSPAVQTVNVNLPRGARAQDISKALNVAPRRNGTRYANPVVHYQ